MNPNKINDNVSENKSGIHSPEGTVVEQFSTRGDGKVELKEAFHKDEIDFSGAVDHLRIHTEGDVAGSQFNSEVFDSPEAVIDMVKHVLPESLDFDQNGMAELTLTVENSVMGFTGVKSLDAIKSMPGVKLEQGMRIPGGEPAEVDGIKGAWYPESGRNAEGKFEVILDGQGNVKNPHGKFEPEAWLAQVDSATAKETLATDKVTVIIRKNQESGVPEVLTAYPGENAPAFPAKIDTESYKADSLKTGQGAEYWKTHAFLRTV